MCSSDLHPSEVTYVMQNLLDSHDTDRAVSMARNPDRVYNKLNRVQDNPDYDGSKPGPEEYRRLRLAALIQMTYVGAPMIWYGTEVGMWGANDPHNRRPMLWPELEPYGDAPDNVIMPELHEWYRSAIALRNAHPALRTGSFRTILADDERDVWAFVREGSGESLLVVVNAAREMQRVPLPIDLGGGWTPVFGERPVGATEGFPDVMLGPLSGRVWHRGGDR